MTVFAALLRNRTASICSRGRDGGDGVQEGDRGAGARWSSSVFFPSWGRRDSTGTGFPRRSAGSTGRRLPRDQVRRRLPDLFGPGDQQVRRVPVSGDEPPGFPGVQRETPERRTRWPRRRQRRPHHARPPDDTETLNRTVVQAAIRFRHLASQVAADRRSRRPNPPCSPARPRHGAAGSRRRPHKEGGGDDQERAVACPRFPARSWIAFARNIRSWSFNRHPARGLHSSVIVIPRGSSSPGKG